MSEVGEDVQGIYPLRVKRNSLTKVRNAFFLKILVYTPWSLTLLTRLVNYLENFTERGEVSLTLYLTPPHPRQSNSLLTV